MITIPELTPEVREQLKQEHAHRAPELKYFPKPGDDGRDVRLPVVLGNPSGACKMPSGARVSRAWGIKVAETFGVAPDSDMRALVADCVLWPPPPVWAKWIERWPGLVKSVRPALVEKYGGDTDQLSEPEGDPPGALAEARAANAGASWVRFSSGKGEIVDLVIKAPTSFQWASFEESMRSPGADHWALVLDLADACVAASSVAAREAFARWPGLAILVNRQAAYLAGLSSKYEEGEL